MPSFRNPWHGGRRGAARRPRPCQQQRGARARRAAPVSLPAEGEREAVISWRRGLGGLGAPSQAPSAGTVGRNLRAVVAERCCAGQWEGPPAPSCCCGDDRRGDASFSTNHFSWGWRGRRTRDGPVGFLPRRRGQEAPRRQGCGPSVQSRSFHSVPGLAAGPAVTMAVIKVRPACVWSCHTCRSWGVATPGAPRATGATRVE